MSDLITEWNAIIDFHINEKDINQPTLEFFYNALESILRKLNVNVDAIKEQIPDQDFDRLFKIAFVKYVDALYKISNSANSFFYMDLIKPSKKKCTHILKTLLNYLHYVEMVKNEVSERANKLLKEYDVALSECNELQTRNEAIEQRSKKIDMQLEDFEKTIPERQKTIKDLGDRKKALTQESIKLYEDLKSLESEHINLELKKNDLQQLIVCEGEYEGLNRSLEKLQLDYREVCNTRESNQKSNIVDEDRINKLKMCLDALEYIHSVQKNECEKTAKDLMTKVADLQKEFTHKAEEEKLIAKTTQHLRILLSDFENEYAKMQKDLQELRFESEYKLQELDAANDDVIEVMQVLTKRTQELTERNSQLAIMNSYLIQTWRIVLTENMKH